LGKLLRRGSYTSGARSRGGGRRRVLDPGRRRALLNQDAAAAVVHQVDGQAAPPLPLPRAGASLPGHDGHDRHGEEEGRRDVEAQQGDDEAGEARGRGDEVRRETCLGWHLALLV